MLDELTEGKLLLIDKPLEWTSFDVVNKVRWNIRDTFKLKKFKVGHAGTLDPKATGLLLLCTGKATKKIIGYQGLDKTYTGTFKLGATTASYDTEKEENETFEIGHITEEMIHDATHNFLGETDQIPPIFSAIKKDGKKLYKLARRGVEVEIEPRKVHIKKFKITNIALPFIQFEVKCSKGTYIRSLAHDFGKALNSGAYLTELRRTAIGDYKIENADNNCLEKTFYL
jgi:tRNA pseudouridine55 synthase